jgi:hypothetical protein
MVAMDRLPCSGDFDRKSQGHTVSNLDEKREHVRRATQTRDHTCHWPRCDWQVPPAMFMCKVHWFKLPKYLRDKIWNAYIPGQEATMTPTEEYLAVADEAQRWIADHTA